MSSQDEERVDFSKQRTSWKIVLARMFGNVVISEEDVRYVVVNKAEKQISYGRNSWYLKMHKVIKEISQKPRSL